YLSAILLICSNSWAGDDLEEAKKVALKEYRDFIGLCLDPVSKAQLGLSAEDGVENVTLGEPFALRLILPDNIRSYTPGKTVTESSEPIKSYHFPVLFNNTFKLILTVDKYKGNDTYIVASLGLDWLAKEMRRVLQKWPLEKGYTPMLCMSPQTHYYSFHIPQKDALNLTLITPQTRDAKGAYAELSHLDTAMKEYTE
ncbi:MAG: hypothetical protein GY852_06780, partial [bacterium]|nr:hypothetical protein [bacterium]